ncbi:aminotransferase class I/II-fold pyridoxal phosphate-dependent enzyme [Aureibacillus halotolerans]|uniref:DNA-binding transcriptional MocR family regulator n=1 Tax=Aureibacillus halotolerans TaxID=1508390 RepID=A0A4R6TWT4_9BACI|nr:aminotransferase class I/II-fold pyridoxal phosphate-dependent enzyme [Aureibacillus halotolerans]TDQ37726.1 DNA-binding transcriptional MocR family regulator [Aureibacillus halotolerans]
MDAQSESRLKQLQHTYATYKQENLKLDMSRGKPSPEQLDLSNAMLDYPSSKDAMVTESGVDIRNYGGLDGLPEMKKLFADLLSVTTDEVIVGGNSSLTLMHDTIARALLHGVRGSNAPWGQQKVKFICPTPGYDRHFSICEHFGIEMIPVDMTDDGPDMAAVESLVAEDETIKGIWCVPKYSNPTGSVFSDEVIERLAKMETKAPDFRILWDNAYIVHYLTDRPATFNNIFTACEANGHSDRIFAFVSTSKISFAGAGIAALAASKENIDAIKKHLAMQTIGPDKINQVRHLHFFKDAEGVVQHMQKHADILKPKFDKVFEVFEEQLGGKDLATWSAPDGGYFISVDTLNDCAKEVVRLAKEAGVVLTNAGATFPYGKDPLDRNIRIAPSFPTVEELDKAMRVFCTCVELVSLQKQ